MKEGGGESGTKDKDGLDPEAQFDTAEGEQVTGDAERVRNLAAARFFRTTMNGYAHR